MLRRMKKKNLIKSGAICSTEAFIRFSILNFQFNRKRYNVIIVIIVCKAQNVSATGKSHQIIHFFLFAHWIAQ